MLTCTATNAVRCKCGDSLSPCEVILRDFTALHFVVRADEERGHAIFYSFHSSAIAIVGKGSVHVGSRHSDQPVLAIITQIKGLSIDNPRGLIPVGIIAVGVASR